MSQLNLTLTAKESELLDKIVEKTGARRQEIVRECIRQKYFELYPIRKVSESVTFRSSAASAATTPEKPMTRKEFLFLKTNHMDVDESLAWQRANQEEIKKYPY